MARQVLDQLAEIHALVRSEIEDDLAAVERVLHVHKLHIQLVLLDLLLADLERLALLGGIRVAHAAIRFRCDAQHHLERLHDLLVRHLGIALHHIAELNTARRLHDRAVAFLHVQRAGIKIVNASVVFEPDANHSCHVFLFSFSMSAASTESTVSRPLAPSESRRRPSLNICMIP